MDTESTKLQTLHTQITSLTSLQNRIQHLRTIPQTILRAQDASLLPTSSITVPLQDLKDITGTLRTKEVQDALKAATESEKADSKGVGFGIRREMRRKRRPPSPESPKPYRDNSTSNSSPNTTSQFPTPIAPPLCIPDLPAYIRTFNKDPNHIEQRILLHIWFRSKPPRSLSERMDEDGNEEWRFLGNPVVVRFCIKDVVTVFVRLLHEGDGVLIVETVTAFGPRERKSPHSQSDYKAYQTLTQQISKTIQSNPTVSFQSLVSMLKSYVTLFTSQCTSCRRVLSSEDHVPPVGRLWVEDDSVRGKDEKGGSDSEAKEAEEGGRWEAKHVDCMRS